MMATLGNGEKELLFSVETEDNGTFRCLYLHIDDTLIIPFRDLNEWKKFANDMLAMESEIQDNINTL
jgi:hypothetical protein